MNIFSDEFYDLLNEQLDEKGAVVSFDGELSDLFEKLDEYVKRFYYFNVKSYGYVYDFMHKNDKYEISKNYGPDILYKVVRNDNAANYIDIHEVGIGLLRGRENLETFDRMRQIMNNLEALNRMNAPMDEINKEINQKILSMKKRV